MSFLSFLAPIGMSILSGVLGKGVGNMMGGGGGGGGGAGNVFSQGIPDMGPGAEIDNIAESIGTQGPLTSMGMRSAGGNQVAPPSTEDSGSGMPGDLGRMGLMLWNALRQQRGQRRLGSWLRGIAENPPKPDFLQ